MENDNFNDSQNPESFCKAKILSECQSEPVRPFGKNGPLVVNLPVVISQTRVHINMESSTKLSRPILKIRNCIRNVSVKHCRLLDLGNKKKGKIFMDGFIIEDIEYEELEYSTYGSIYFTKVKFPFEFTAKIDYFQSLVIETSNLFYPVKILEQPSSPDIRHGSAFYDEYWRNSQNGTNLHEALYCKLDEIKILEADMTLHGKNKEKNGFDTISDKIMISIRFTLLQEQLVNIPRF